MSQSDLLRECRNCIDKLMQSEADEFDCNRLLAKIDAHLAQPEVRWQETLTHTRTCAAWTPMEDCDCCLKERIALQTEQTMHAAWRKRAEEAEAQLAAQPEPVMADKAMGGDSSEQTQQQIGDLMDSTEQGTAGTVPLNLSAPEEIKITDAYHQRVCFEWLATERIAARLKGLSDRFPKVSGLAMALVTVEAETADLKTKMLSRNMALAFKHGFDPEEHTLSLSARGSNELFLKINTSDDET